MMISSISPSMVSQTNALVSNLRANGLTPNKAILAATDVKGAIQQIGMVQRGPANKAAITAALQERISADVAAGNLTADDAAAVFKTFEEMDPARQVGGSGAKARAPRAEGDAPSLTKEQIDAQIAQIGAVAEGRQTFVGGADLHQRFIALVLQLGAAVFQAREAGLQRRDFLAQHRQRIRPSVD